MHVEAKLRPQVDLPDMPSAELLIQRNRWLLARAARARRETELRLLNLSIKRIQRSLSLHRRPTWALAMAYWAAGVHRGAINACPSGGIFFDAGTDTARLHAVAPLGPRAVVPDSASKVRPQSSHC